MVQQHVFLNSIIYRFFCALVK